MVFTVRAAARKKIFNFMGMAATVHDLLDVWFCVVQVAG
jgi:hypothetical protein